MDSTAGHMNHHQMNMLPNAALPDNSMGMMMDESGHRHMDSQHNAHMEHMNHMDHSDGMSMMKMYFHFGLGDMVLFKNLVMDSNTTLMLTCLVLFLSGILLELID
jgi:hypothetical protein